MQKASAVTPNLNGGVGGMLWPGIFIGIALKFSFLQLFVRDAKDIWNKMKDLREREKDAHFMTHDGTFRRLRSTCSAEPC